MGIAIATLAAVLLDGSGRVVRAVALAGLAGMWIPLLEAPQNGSAGPLLALVFAGAGAAAGLLILRNAARGSAS